MINIIGGTVIKFALTLMMLTFLLGCETKNEFHEEAVTQEMQNVFDDFYSKYDSGDISFINYYSENVIHLAPSGEFTEGVEEFCKNWEQRLEDDAFELLALDSLAS